MIRTTEFTLRHYRDLVIRTAESYPCLGFEVLDQPELPERFTILRHDIDTSPEAARDLAIIEAELGVRATFTVLLTGVMYNPFESATRDILREIVALGHDIGLHFDASWHGIDSEDRLEDAITWQARTLDHILGLEGENSVRMFSFHNTTPFTMSCRQTHFAGLRNAYAGVLQERVQYTSDSNGYWIHRSWGALLDGRHPRLQVLTHPEWWSAEEAEPAEKICRRIACRSLEAWGHYCSALRSFGRMNRTGLKHAASLLPELYGEKGEWIVLSWLSGRRVNAFIAAFACLEREHPAAGVVGDRVAALRGLRDEAILGAVPEHADDLEGCLDTLALAAAEWRATRVGNAAEPRT